jgi:hypothetical protein
MRPNIARHERTPPRLLQSYSLPSPREAATAQATVPTTVQTPEPADPDAARVRDRTALPCRIRPHTLPPRRFRPVSPTRAAVGHGHVRRLKLGAVAGA